MHETVNGPVGTLIIGERLADDLTGEGGGQATDVPAKLGHELRTLGLQLGPASGEDGASPESDRRCHYRWDWVRGD